MMAKKRCGSIILAAGIIAVSWWLPSMGNLSAEAVSAMGILLASLVLWTSEALPMAITTVLMICVLVMEGIMSFDEAIAGINTETALFIMASSGITIALLSCTIPQRLTRQIINRFGDQVGKLVVCTGLIVTVFSAFMSSLATCALFGGLIDSVIDRREKSLRRCLMMCVPACAGIGGFMSPAGTPANILLLSVFAQHGYTVTFVQWAMVGFPIGLLAAVLFLCAAVALMKPKVEHGAVSGGQDALPSESGRDMLTAVILIATVLCWFLSSWIKGMNITMIAIISLTVMFLPGVDLLDWNRFSRNVNWDLVITMGTVSVLMLGIGSTGLIRVFASFFMSLLVDMPGWMALFVASIVICALRAFIPTTTAVVMLFAPLLIEIAGTTGYGVPTMLMILAFWTASALLLVYTEPIYLITYQKHDYSAMDLFKVGLIPSFMMSAVLAFVLPALLTWLKIG